MSYAKISDFRSHFKNVGLPVSSHYNVIFSEIGNATNTRTVQMLCDSVAIPGISIMSAELRTVGEVTDSPFLVSYPPIDFSFYEDNKFSSRRFFSEWTNRVYNRQTRTVGYYNDYTKNVDIIVSNREGKAIFAIRLHEAWPKSISDSALGYANHDILKLNVQIVYKYHEIMEVSETGEVITPSPKNIESKKTSSGNFNLVENITKETLGNLNRVGSLGKGLTNIESFDFGANIGSSLDVWGPSMGADLLRQTKSIDSLMSVSGLPQGSELGSAFANSGYKFNDFGMSISDLGKSLSNVTAVASSVGQTISGVAGSMQSVNTVLKTLGIETGMEKTITDMKNNAGKISVLSQIGGLPGNLGAVGSNMGALGGQIQEAAKGIANLPNATNQIFNAVNNIGKSLGTRGSELSNASSSIQSSINNGLL